MSEELIQRNLIEAPEKMGSWNYYNIGSTSLNALKRAKIIPNCDYSEYENKKPDAIIIKKPVVVAVIEYKQPKELKTKRQIIDAIEQEIGTARVLKAKIFIVTDGKKTFWINPLTGNEILTEDNKHISTNFNKNKPETISLINNILSSINSSNDRLIPVITVDPLPLAEKVWQDLWAVSGATPENCLYTFVEIFIFKYLSDLGVLKGIYSFSNLLNQYKENDENEVLEYYASTTRIKIKELFPGNHKDKTTIINGTIFVSKDDKAVTGYGTVFKKILQRFAEFGSFENINRDFKSKLFETFLKESISKKNWGQFFTPLKVVRSIVNMADIRPGLKICDPACGVGKFLLEPILDNMSKYYRVENNSLKSFITLVGFDKGFDKDEQKTIILAKANMLIYMSNLIRENPNISDQFAKLFNETFTLQTNSILGTLAKPIKDEYDLILTNPPYVMSGSSNLKDEIAKSEELKNYYTINAMGIEGLFTEWIIRALKPDGKAFIIVPDGIMNRSNDKRLRDYILDSCTLDAIISLPLNTFFTTNKKTYILVLTKKVTKKENDVEITEKQTTPVFSYLCSEIGETRDVYRFEIENNDLITATNLFNMFKGAKTSFSSTDKRCKIFDIDKFYSSSHWSIDRYWTNEEKIELGIEDEIDSVDIEGYINLINDVATSITEYDEPLRELLKKKESLTSTAEISLSNNNLFELALGKRLLKKDFVNSSGAIPVYSANVFEPFVYTNESNIEDFSLPYVVWGIDGNFKFNVIPAGQKFASTDHCGTIKIRNKKIHPTYLAYILEQNKNKYGFDRGLRASLANVKTIKFSIPIDSNGEFDYEAQEYVADVLSYVQQLNHILREKQKIIENVKLFLNNDEFLIKYFPLLDIFETNKGKGLYTRKYGNEHKGNYPVYSASSQKPLTYVDTYDFDGKFLTWATNGFAGTVSVMEGKFSINGDRGILLPKNGRKDIDFDYIKYTIEPVFRSLAKGRKGDHGADEFTKLYPSMLKDVSIPFPVDKTGFIRMEDQREIAKIYLSIEQNKQELIDKINSIIEQNLILQ